MRGRARACCSASTRVTRGLEACCSERRLRLSHALLARDGEQRTRFREASAELPRTAWALTRTPKSSCPHHHSTQRPVWKLSCGRQRLCGSSATRERNAYRDTSRAMTSLPQSVPLVPKTCSTAVNMSTCRTSKLQEPALSEQAFISMLLAAAPHAQGPTHTPHPLQPVSQTSTTAPAAGES